MIRKRRKPLMLMRKKGMTGSHLARHAGIPGLSKAAQSGGSIALHPTMGWTGNVNCT